MGFLRELIRILRDIFMSILFLLILVALAVAIAETSEHIFPDVGGSSDPGVYERYVDDMRRAGRKPNGELLELNIGELK